MSKFQKGRSGNPSGRPKGTKSAPNLLRDGLVGLADLKEVVAVIVKKARAGDLQAAAILLDRTVPRLKPAADIADEAQLAEETAAARIRGARSEGSALLTLEELVAGSMAAWPVTPTHSTGNSPTPERPQLASEAASTLGAAKRPTRHICIPMPTSDPNSLICDDPYNPL